MESSHFADAGISITQPSAPTSGISSYDSSENLRSLNSTRRLSAEDLKSPRSTFSEDDKRTTRARADSIVTYSRKRRLESSESDDESGRKSSRGTRLDFAAMTSTYNANQRPTSPSESMFDCPFESVGRSFPLYPPPLPTESPTTLTSTQDRANNTSPSTHQVPSVFCPHKKNPTPGAGFSRAEEDGFRTPENCPITHLVPPPPPRVVDRGPALTVPLPQILDLEEPQDSAETITQEMATWRIQTLVRSFLPT